MTTTQTPAPLPFLLPAANLAVGDTLASGAVIDARETAPGGKIHITLTDGTALEPMDPGELVEVQPRRDVTLAADLATLAGQWEAQAKSDEATGDATRLMMAGVLRRVAREVRALLAPRFP